MSVRSIFVHGVGAPLKTAELRMVDGKTWGDCWLAPGEVIFHGDFDKMFVISVKATCV